MEITLTTPFNYNNIDNLVIAVDQNTPGVFGDYTKWKAMPSAASRSISKTNYQSNVDPASPGSGWVQTDRAQVQLAFPEACPGPDGLAAVNITQTSATVNWNAGTATQWEVKHGVAGFNFATAPSQVLTTNSYPLTDLSAFTSYSLYVRTICGPGDSSSWVGPFTFTTACGEISTFPWSEDFESVNEPHIPSCWSQLDADGGARKWASSYFYNHTSGEGSSQSMFHDYTSVGNQVGWLYTPAFILPETGEFSFSFWSMNVYTENYGKNSLHISTSGTDTTDFTQIWTPEGGVTENWVRTVIDLTPYLGDTIYFAFRYEGYNAHRWFIDDLLIRAKSNENDITSFSFALQTGPAIIDTANHTVTIEVSHTANISYIRPIFTYSENAICEDMVSGLHYNFTNPRIINITSETGITQPWTIFATAATSASSQKEILTFSFIDINADAVVGANTVDVLVPWGTDVTNLMATITISNLATISPMSYTYQDFTNPVIYTVTAQDSSTKAYTVTVTVGELPVGATCENPHLVTIPADLVYQHFGQTTCGLDQIYSNGEEAIYKLIVTNDTYVRMTLDPKTTS